MDAKGVYRRQAIETASPARLVSMLLHGAIARAVGAREHIDSGQPELANVELQRAQAIVDELHSTLDYQQGGQIAQNLSSLYRYVIEQLVEANTYKRSEPLTVVCDVLGPLASAWDEIAAGPAGQHADHGALRREVTAYGVAAAG